MFVFATFGGNISVFTILFDYLVCVLSASVYFHTRVQSKTES